MWTLYWVYGLVDRSLKSRLIQLCRMCTAVCAACSRATSARNWRTSAIRNSVSFIAPVSPRGEGFGRRMEHFRIGNFRVTVAVVLPILGAGRMRYYEASSVIAADADAV